MGWIAKQGNLMGQVEDWKASQCLIKPLHIDLKSVDFIAIPWNVSHFDSS